MNNDEEDKKCKGVKKEITFKDYKDCLFTEKDQGKSMNVFRSRKHTIYTENIKKVALSSNNDKRVILEDKINTAANRALENTRKIKCITTVIK